MKKLQKIKPLLKNWNNDVFGDFRFIEIALTNRLKELDGLESSGNWSTEYKRERESVKKELSELLVKKEISIRQKMKIQWANEGDANSRLFHRLLNVRKSKNFISKIELDNGEVLTREEDVVREIVHFFETLFSYDDHALRGYAGVEWEGITTILSSWLERPFTEEEVKIAVFECEGDKAPSPDGYSITVFQSQWDTIKIDLMKVFEEFHTTGVINGITNETYLLNSKEAQFKSGSRL